MKTIYALLVGIDKYPSLAPNFQLSSCKKDVETFDNYLKNCDTDQYTLNEVVLLDEQATKLAVCLQFIKHLGRAKKGDLAIFYFSGHGCQEKANLFWQKLERSDVLETLVLYDFAKDGQTGLADKELRYLRKKIDSNQAELITIFDCCHAGGAMRGLMQSKKVNYVNESKIAGFFPERPWEKFIFAKDAEILANRQNERFIDPTPYILIAACQSNELAYQDVSGSLFTNALVESLKVSPDLTYGQLHEKVQISVSGQKLQTPKAESVGNEDALRKVFLSGSIKYEYDIHTLYYDGADKQWKLNIGAIQGLKKDSEVILRETGIRLPIQAVLPTQTIVEAQLDSTKSYDVKVKGLSRTPTRIALQTNYEQGSFFGSQVLLKKVAEKSVELAEWNLILSTNLEQADFSLVVYRNPPAPTGPQVPDAGYSLTFPEPVGYEPYDLKKSLGPPFQFSDLYSAGEAAEALVSAFIKVARWNYLKGLSNVNTQMQDSPIQLIVRRKSGDDSMGEWTNPDKAIQVRKEDTIEFEIKNTSILQPFYTYAFLLEQDCSVIDILGNGTSSTKIDKAGTTQKPLGFSFSRLTVSDSIVAANRPYESIWVNVVYATEGKKFNLAGFVQAGLNRGERGEKREAVRGSESPFYFEEWATLMVEIRIVNPTHLSFVNT